MQHPNKVLAAVVENMSATKLISICMITYNHEQYICQAIDSLLLQKTEHRIEIVIGEDCSTDGTRSICEQYAAAHPQIIRLLPLTQNLGISKNFYRTLEACNGDYIAICEGDDYWTDELKLQKQAELLNSDASLSIVSANADSLVNGITIHRTIETETENYYGIEGLVNDWKCQTLTVMCRKAMLDFVKLKSYSILYDTMLFYELLQKGKGFFLNQTVGVYRHHNAGAWHGKSEQQKMKFVIAQFYEIWTKNKKDPFIKNKIKQSIIDYLRGATLFSTNEPKYYWSLIFKYLQVTKDYKYLTLLFTNNVRHLRNN